MERILIVNDEYGQWFIRRVAVVEHDIARDEKVYRCDKHLGGPYSSIDEAIDEFMDGALMLSEHDRNCMCPGAQWARHKNECRKPEDDLPLLGCDCDDCQAELHECPEDCEECLGGIGEDEIN